MATSVRTATTDRALWFTAFGGAAAWSVDEMAAFAWHEDYCSAFAYHGVATVSAPVSQIIMIALAVVMLGVAGWALLVGWRARQALGVDDGMGGTDLDRRRFMATWGIVANALFMFGILLRGIATVVLSTNLCNR